MALFTIDVNFSNLIISIAPATQAFLKSIVLLYTPADLAALAALQARMQATKAKIDLIDAHTQQIGKL